MNTRSAVCPVLIGRDEEVAALSPAADQRQLTLIAGEAGMSPVSPCTSPPACSLRLHRERCSSLEVSLPSSPDLASSSKTEESTN